MRSEFYKRGNFVIQIISWRHTVAPHGGKLGQHSGC